jgi:hypothetical protein
MVRKLKTDRMKKMSSTSTEILEVISDSTEAKKRKVELSTSYLTPSGEVFSESKSSSTKPEMSFTYKVINYILINDQKFSIEKENDQFYVSHEKWSLTGMGNTLEEALIDLRNEAKELFLDLREQELTSLSYEALIMRDFLFKFV